MYLVTLKLYTLNPMMIKQFKWKQGDVYSTSGHEYAEESVGANSFYWHSHIHRVVQGNRAGEGRGGEYIGTPFFYPDCA